MAVYICNICGEKHECEDRPMECVVCGSQDFRMEGESVPQGEVHADLNGGDIDHLFARHNMVFPPVRAEQDQKEKQKYEAAAREQAQEKSDKVRKTANNFKETSFFVISVMCLLGELVGWASCPFTATPFPWIILSVSSAVIYVINKKSYDKYIQGTKEAAQRVLDDCEEEIVRYGTDQIKKYQAYHDEFTMISQKLSQEYVRTEFVNRIAEWIFEPLDRKIGEADREERIAAVRVEHAYSVYSDRIVCSRGTYDYRGHGLQNVDDPVCQTALSIAIAAAVKILIMQKYPQDPSGTPITVSTEISYGMDYLTETVVYAANNGNYNAASVW